MGEKSSIQWTNATWNPIVGCKIHSPGCKLCYAMHEAARQIRCAAGLKRETHYADTVKIANGRPVWTGKINAAPDRVWELPLRWRKPRMIFVNSMSDLFAEGVPEDWIDRAFATMALSPQHTFQVLTKRSARMRAYLSDVATVRRIYDLACDIANDEALKVVLIAHPGMAAHAPPGPRVLLGNWPLPNVWPGVSTERQQEADERIPDLLATPAAVRFISAEPLIAPIDLTRLNLHSGAHTFFDATRGRFDIRGTATQLPNPMPGPMPLLDWVIAGGESSRLNVEDPRPMHPDWARSLRDQCAAAGVPFFFKQWGDWLPGHHYTEELKRLDSCLEQSRFACADWDGDRSFDTDGLAGWDDLGPDAMWRVGTAKAGRILDGRTHDAFPAVAA